MVRDCSPGRENVDLLFLSDMGRGRRPNFVIFVVWSALIIGELVVAA